MLWKVPGNRQWKYQTWWNLFYFIHNEAHDRGHGYIYFSLRFKKTQPKSFTMKHPAMQQYHYHKWANDRVFEHLRSLPENLYDNEVKSVFSSIRAVLAHMYLVDGMWLSVMSGDNFSQTMAVIEQLQEKSEGQPLEKMKSLYEKVNQDYESFLNEHKDLDKPMKIHHPEFGELETPVTEMVKHVVNHGTYHRGNISAMLRQQGQSGVSTDYIFFLFEND